ncbi:MAG: bile acid:sodium symporter [Desulfarculaceae bacterium]|nr:bile acid:sodium symporter [Desulfarculaceae bacterium]
MWALLKKINQNLVLAIPIMMLLGFVYGQAGPIGWLRSLIIPLTFLMVYPMMVNLKINQVFSGGDYKSQVLAQAINFTVVPLAALGLGWLFFGGNPYLMLGLLLAGLVPTSGMTISWTGFAGGKLAAAVKMTVVGLILGSLATPLYVEWLLGSRIEMQVSKVFTQIGLIVFLPMAAGWLTRRWLVGRVGLEDFSKRLAPRFPALSTVGVLGIVFVAMALKSGEIAAAPLRLLALLPPLALLYAFNYGLSTLLGRWLLPRGEAIALVYGTVMRNLSIALALAMSAFGPEGSEAALIIAVAYVVQVQSAAWYVRFTDNVFGPARAAAPA